ncbi:hypothetical protein NSQ77_14640 [Oceanobacillus sp. FSL K6-2867]|uniref:hypothetical protein n=1 Tax=Oceanobacillus sp. FSL K6-2867 TaxID=2954748 RepID=UPI0030DC38D8
MMGILLVSLTTVEISAASRVIAIGPGSADDVGYEFKTTETISRSELVEFLDEVKFAESSEDALNTARFSIVSAVITHPITQTLKYSVGASLGSGIISYLMINKDLGSENIQKVLNESTAENFNVTIKYEKGTRDQDKWYEATGMSINPA